MARAMAKRAAISSASSRPQNPERQTGEWRGTLKNCRSVALAVSAALVLGVRHTTHQRIGGRSDPGCPSNPDGERSYQDLCAIHFLGSVLALPFPSRRARACWIKRQGLLSPGPARRPPNPHSHNQPLVLVHSPSPLPRPSGFVIRLAWPLPSLYSVVSLASMVSS
jgi:hypothetical protein